MTHDTDRLRDVLRWHLRTNFSPPLPEAFTDVALSTLEMARTRTWSGLVEWPEDVDLVPRDSWRSESGETVTTVMTAIEILGLRPWLDDGSWDDKD